MSATVGIAIPAYGRGRHLRETLESALGQTRKASEIVVVDDCSPDETGEVAKSFERYGVKYFRNPTNLGVPANYNESLGKLATDYVMILEDHDLLEPTYLEECAGLMDEYPEVNLVACWIAGIEEDSGRTVEVFTPRFNRIQDGSKLAEYLVTRPDAPLGLTALIRRHALAGLEPWFDPKYWWYADIHLWIRLAQRGKFGYVPNPLLKMRRREPTHFLTDRDWDGLVCCNRIRRDNRANVFANKRHVGALKWTKYVASRDYEAIKVFLSRLAQGNRRIPDDARDLLSTPAWLAVRMLSAMPIPCARAIRSVHHVLVPRI